MDTEISKFYNQFGCMTDPGAQADLLVGLPQDLQALVKVVQGVQVHVFWAERYGLDLPQERKEAEVSLRPAARKLARIRELEDRPLVEARPLEKRLVGNCRDFSVLLAMLLQSQGIPARPRCGFGAYFLPNHYEDHWVCEVWDSALGRWKLVDAQLDDFQQGILETTFDTLDVPRHEFVTGGKAWQMCRSGQADPDTFGIFEWHGMGFVRGNLLRDFLALNKLEILPWDMWGLFVKKIRI